MGYRLHVAKKHIVEWGDVEAFNYKVEEFHDFLDTLDIPYSGSSIDDDFEVAKEDWKKGIDILVNFDSLDDNSSDLKYNIEDVLEDLKCTREEMIRIMKLYLEEAPPDSDYMHFAFF